MQCGREPEAGRERRQAACGQARVLSEWIELGSTTPRSEWPSVSPHFWCPFTAFVPLGRFEERLPTNPLEHTLQIQVSQGRGREQEGGGELGPEWVVGGVCKAESVAVGLRSLR